MYVVYIEDKGFIKSEAYKKDNSPAFETTNRLAHARLWFSIAMAEYDAQEQGHSYRILRIM